jgi:PRC-barrel domain
MASSHRIGATPGYPDHDAKELLYPPERSANSPTHDQGVALMAEATVHPNHKLISSEDVEGTSVYSPNRDQIGSIDHLMIDKVSGKISYAVMSFGGFLGLGHSHYPIPWSSLRYDKGVEGFVTNISEAQLRDAPAFSDDSWQDRNWEDSVHRHYDAQPYWI